MSVAEVNDIAWVRLAKEGANEMAARIVRRGGPGSPFTYLSESGDASWAVWKLKLSFVTSRILWARCDAARIVRSTVSGWGVDLAEGTLPDGRKWVYRRFPSEECGTLLVMEDVNAPSPL